MTRDRRGSTGRSPTLTGGRAAGARLLHRGSEAVALEDGAVVTDEPPLHVEADAVHGRRAARDLEVQRPGAAVDVVSAPSGVRQPFRRLRGLALADAPSQDVTPSSVALQMCSPR